MSSLLKYLQFKNAYNEEHEKSSNLHIFQGNYVLSAFLLISNSTLFLYLLLIYIFESNDQYKLLIFKMILSECLSLFLAIFNCFIVYSITVPSDSFLPRILEENIFKYIEKKNICVFTNCLMTVPFQIIYYLCKEYYTNHSDLIFLFMGIEYIIRYVLTINFYYSYSVIIVVSSLTTLFIHSLFFQNLFPLLTLQYSTNFLFSALFANIYEKYLKYRFLDNNVQKNERSFLTEVIDNMQCAYLLTDKATILYRNKAFDLFLSETKDIISSKCYRKDMYDSGNINIYIDMNEIVKEMIETLFGKAESHEYFDYDLNIEIVNFFIEELQNCGNTEEREHSFTNSFFEFNKLNRNLLGNIQSPRENIFDNDQMKIKLNLPLLSEESDEDSHFNSNSFRKKINQSLFKKKEDNLLPKGDKDSGREKIKKRISLYKLHDFLSRFKDEFKDFTRLATIPIETLNETKFFEVNLKISDIFEDNKLKYEYVINDVTKIKASDLLKKEIKFKSLFLAKIAHEIKNPIITISNLCQTLNSKVSQINNLHNTTYVSSDEDSDDERNNNLNRRGSYINVSSIQETSSFIVNTGNYMMSLIEDLNYFSKMEQQNKNLSDIPQNISHIDEFTEFEIKPVLEFCLTIFRLRQKIDENKKGVRILSDYDKRIPERINSSEVKLKQILINLLSNAYKFTIFGNIKLIARVIEREQKNFLHFEVSDTGTGIPHDQIQNLCNPFSMTSKNQNLNQYGSGLGLFIVKDLLKKLNTTLIINSTEGKGSTFAFEIEYKPKKRESILFDEKASMKTLKHYPVMTESLKNFYTLFNVKNIHESSENIDESFSKLGKLCFDLRKHEE
jgi:signal transduction histidine kinase